MKMLLRNGKRAACLLAAALFIGGTGCFDSTQNPVAALSAVEKITVAVAAIEDGSDPFAAVQGALDQLTPSELASAANIVGGLDLSLDDAQSIMDLMDQVDESTLQQLEAANIDFDNVNNAPEVVADALGDAGVEDVSPEDVELLYDLFQIFYQ